MNDGEAQRRAALEEVWVTVHLEVDRDGVRSTPMDVAAEHGDLVHVVTAWNPSSSPVDDEVNAAADVALCQVLHDAGASLDRCTGSNPDGSWREEGWAATGLTRVKACAIGRQFGQDAIYEATAESLRIVWCDSGRSVTVAKPGG